MTSARHVYTRGGHLHGIYMLVTSVRQLHAHNICTAYATSVRHVYARRDICATATCLQHLYGMCMLLVTNV